MPLMEKVILFLGNPVTVRLVFTIRSTLLETWNQMVNHLREKKNSLLKDQKEVWAV